MYQVKLVMQQTLEEILKRLNIFPKERVETKSITELMTKLIIIILDDQTLSVIENKFSSPFSVMKTVWVMVQPLSTYTAISKSLLWLLFCVDKKWRKLNNTCFLYYNLELLRFQTHDNINFIDFYNFNRPVICHLNICTIKTW